MLWQMSSLKIASRIFYKKFTNLHSDKCSIQRNMCKKSDKHCQIVNPFRAKLHTIPNMQCNLVGCVYFLKQRPSGGCTHETEWNYDGGTGHGTMTIAPLQFCSQLCLLQCFKLGGRARSLLYNLALQHLPCAIQLYPQINGIFIIGFLGPQSRPQCRNMVC